MIFLIKYQKQRPPIPEDCPPEYANIIRQCWDDLPAKRPSANTTSALLEDKRPKMHLNSPTSSTKGSTYLCTSGTNKNYSNQVAFACASSSHIWTLSCNAFSEFPDLSIDNKTGNSFFFFFCKIIFNFVTENVMNVIRLRE